MMGCKSEKQCFGAALVCLFLLFGVLAGCDKIPFLQNKVSKKPIGQQPPADAIVVAKVGSLFVTEDDLKREVETYNNLLMAQGLTQNKIDTRDKKIAYLKEELTRKFMLFQEAMDRGLDRKKDVSSALEYAKRTLLVEQLISEELEKLDVSSKEVEDFYNQNKQELRDPEQRKVFEIVTANEADAKQVYIQLLQGGDFISLAKQYSKAPTASAGGDLGYIGIEADPAKRKKFDKFYEVAFSPTLESGGISNIFKGPDGFYIVKLESVKKSEIKPLSAVSENLKRWLLLEKQQKAITDLSAKLSGETKVEVYENKVE